MRLGIFAAIAVAGIVIMASLFFFQTGFISFQQSEEPTIPTQHDLLLVPKQTQDLKHLARTSEVMVIIVDARNVEESNQDFELLVSLVDPDGNLVFNKFITEPLRLELRPLYSGWHAVTITNVGETQVASGARIETHPWDQSQDVPGAHSCITPPYLQGESSRPWPWC